MKKFSNFHSIPDSRWGIPALFWLFNLFFYWKVLFTNRIMFPWDAADFFYPYLSFVHEELRHFRLPLWDPYVMSGYPIIGDLEAQIFYPINWLFVLARPFSPLSYKLVEIQIILHFFLAGLFMYYLARDFTQHQFAALLGGVLFMSSGAMVAHTEHLASINSMAWYPLIFLVARRSLLEKNYFYALAAGMLFGILNLVGHWQHSAYMAFLLFLYFAYEATFGPLRARLWPHWIALLLLIGGVGAALAMVQVIPTHELGNLSIRTYLTYWDVTDGNEPVFLWTLFLPNFTGGLNGVPRWYPGDWSFNYVFLTVPGCLLALLGIVDSLRRRNLFWAALILLCIELSFGRQGHLAELLYRVPILNMFRNMVTFFDVANFALCLMASVGAESLLSGRFSPRWRKHLAIGLFALLLLATAVGLAVPPVSQIPGWYHMLAVLALFSLTVTALLRNQLSPQASAGALLGLMLFQIIHYNMNQKFNWSINDPRFYLSHDYVLGSKGSLEFLRSDPKQDFRVAAFAEYPWSANGWNVWRIPGIFGWNPITLRRYEQYVSEFIQTSNITVPAGGGDHKLHSPMLDLLGAKYVLAAGKTFAQENRFEETDEFTLAFVDSNWWRIYRNKDYISRAWFYPRAYVVPDADLAMDLMNSSWFQTRRTLLLEKGDLRGGGYPLAGELPVLALGPDQIAAASNGQAVWDPICSEPQRVFGYWDQPENWLRLDVAGPAEPGRYLLLMRYNAAIMETPQTIAISATNATREQHLDPITLPRTPDWDCRSTRTAELTQVELGPGQNHIVLTLSKAAPVNVYTLWLVRTPSAPPPEPGSFSFDQFSYSANRLSLTAHLSQEGFVLLNEIYYPGWEAFLDGKPVEILRADGIFRALLAPAGSHHIELRFRPRHFALGAAVSLLMLASFLVCCAVYFRRRSRSEPHERRRGE